MITEEQARLDVNKLQLWRDAGLELNDQGCIVPSQGRWSEYASGNLRIREDMVANGLIFILSKICNFIAKAKDLRNTPASTYPQTFGPYSTEASSFDMEQTALLAEWESLHMQLKSWRSSLPG